MDSHAGWPRRAWEGWKRVARRLGDFQARVLLSLFYFVVVAPFALGVRAFSDPLRRSAPPVWLEKERIGDDVTTYARRQY
jgi:hypothetical protein